jgi:predicted CoA-binding protein
MQRVVILGASNKPDRYAYRAFRMLREHGHKVIPVHPALIEIEGVAAVKDLGSVTGPVETLTLYVSPAISEPLTDSIVALRPGRVIFNPGTESAMLQSALDEAGIPYEEACTLVMLVTGVF